MADPIPQNNPAPPQNTAPANPHLEGVEAPVAANMDSELDSALSAVFKDRITNEEKPAQTVKEDKKQPEKSEPKEDKQPDKPKKPIQGELQEKENVTPEAPKNQQAWTALKNSNKEAHKIIQEREDEIKRLKSGLAEKGSLSTKEIDELKNEVTELSKYRTMVDIQADPEFISKYDQPISKIQASIKDLLGSLNVSQEVVDQVDFSNTKLMDQIIGHVETHRDRITAKKLERKVEEMLSLVDKRDETLSEQKSAYKDFMENKKKESSMKGAEQEGRMIKQIDARIASQDEAGTPSIPFLRKMSPKDGASQAEVAQVNNHNRLVDLMQKRVHEAINVTSPEERADLAIAAVGNFWLNAQLKTANSKIKGLEDELKKISTVGSSSSVSKTKPAGSSAGPREMDLDSALNQHFSR